VKFDKDYFKSPPPPKPTLLFYTEDGDANRKQIPYLDKEIAAMIVFPEPIRECLLCSYLACCVASSVPFLDKFQITKRGPVCILFGEHDENDIHRFLFKMYTKIVKAVQENDKKPVKERFSIPSDAIEKIPSLLCPKSLHGSDASLVDDLGNKTPFFFGLLRELKEMEPEEGWQLIILSPASRFGGFHAEKDNAVATKFVATLECISRSLKGKPTILLAHEKRKDGVDKLHDWVEQVNLKVIELPNE